MRNKHFDLIFDGITNTIKRAFFIEAEWRQPRFYQNGKEIHTMDVDPLSRRILIIRLGGMV
jgi:hypothetical protein